MLIDWFTVGVQIINFLILMALLKRFLYGPIIRAMDERENRIATRLSEAAAARQEAEAKAARLSEEQEEFTRARQRMELEARQEINNWKEGSIERLKEEIAAQRNDWQQGLAEEQEAFLRRLKIHINQQVFLVARKVMADLADASLENRLIKTFLKKIHQEPATLFERNDRNSKTLLVITGFPLDNALKETLRTQLDGSFSSFGEVDFKEEEELGFGIRLLAGDQKWEWTLFRYLRDVEQNILQTMMTETKEQSKAASAKA
jgi:F-type H+-transporting ATPase subunit b